ncbi:MAG: universal stress protein [Acidimicrobiia bacterium]
MRTIVVGVDGSQSSGRALRWAVEEARLRGDNIRAVAVWSYQPVGFGDVFVPPLPVADQSDAVRLAVQEMIEGLGVSDVSIELVVREGNPSTVLLESSSDADLLVVGARGSGGFIGLLMGSVARHVSAHAVCPTVIVPVPSKNAHSS